MQEQKLFKAYLANTRCNQEIINLYSQRLFALCKENKWYCDAVQKQDVKFVVRFLQFGPKRQRFICIEYTSNGKRSRLPISQSRLFAKNKKQQNKRAIALSILRFLISYQIDEFKQANPLLPNQVCPLSNRRLSTCKIAIDHCNGKPFVRLAEQWARESNLDLNQLEFAGRGSNRVLKPAELNDSWQAFHAEQAELQYTCSSANSRKGCRLS